MVSEMLLDPLTVEAGEDGRWRHAPFRATPTPSAEFDMPDRMGVRIDAHEASGRERSSEAQCIFGGALTNAPHPAAKRAVKSSGLGGAANRGGSGISDRCPLYGRCPALPANSKVPPLQVRR